MKMTEDYVWLRFETWNNIGGAIYVHYNMFFSYLVCGDLKQTDVTFCFKIRFLIKISLLVGVIRDENVAAEKIKPQQNQATTNILLHLNWTATIPAPSLLHNHSQTCDRIEVVVHSWWWVSEWAHSCVSNSKLSWTKFVEMEAGLKKSAMRCFVSYSFWLGRNLDLKTHPTSK